MSAPTIAADPILDRVTRAIADRIRPIRISLFGSRSRGDAREDSDYDLMVVVDDQAGADVEGAIHEAIRATGASVDIVVRTASRFEEDRDDVGTLVYAVERDGRCTVRTPARSACANGAVRRDP
ncbi:MAG: nucleotidyltransferase domain-containing protein [Gemmatimonadaceae bacterium]